MSFEIPENVRPIREKVLRFVEDEVYPVEAAVEERDTPEAGEIVRGLMAKAKEQGL